MPKVKYIAAGIKIDSINGVGLRWEPGQVRNVSAEVSERLLVYPDTWVRLHDETLDNVVPIGLAQAEKPVEEPLPVIDFHSMGKKALLEFAERKYNERLDKRQSEGTIRHKVIALFSKNEMPD
ncbi:hypothetical protein SAMN05216403_12732 [Nitrosospira multiformis ATCC 25196]|uniref:Uncharacterized protein n=1 Tax=Nitrosospira multiformis (strain ATCC 25196 / NCIMB 11849 / C 71) TaxID=323848 RepID=Q2Y916_NITMU|nr:hypothetical protein [Nitrosospira multiformis]ABB74755.1 hypothetical protein Nmul_A1452 [Nitrosospira multiformis ATCC 25196]SEG07668.1 hypothetical protein SAMN05216403_12732 [Nitrosospira multiformis ATCC 25196]